MEKVIKLYNSIPLDLDHKPLLLKPLFRVEQPAYLGLRGGPIQPQDRRGELSEGYQQTGDESQGRAYLCFGEA